LDAAGELFLEHGYGGVSMQAIVRRTGGSLATLYRYFGSKEGLFDAILSEIAEEIAAPLLDESLDRRPVDEALQLVGERFLRRLTEPNALAWHRIVVAEGPRQPQLREALLRSGPGRMRKLLAGYLQRQTEFGLLEIIQSELAADHFFSLVKAGVHMAAVCGEPLEIDDALITEHVESAVRVFLHGYAKSSPC
jgi:AcrR family transcriptional regulator